MIYTWKAHEDWQRWFRNERWAELESRVDALLCSSTVYKVFGYD